MPPKVKMLPVNEIAKLIREHNKLSKIEMPKGKERTRPNLIKAIEDAGFKLNHEKKRIERGAQNGERKTDPKKDPKKDPSKIVISKKPPMASMKIKPRASVPTTASQLRKQIEEILKPIPARVKDFKREGSGLNTKKELLKLKGKYLKPYRDQFSVLMDKVEEAKFMTDELYESLDDDFDKKSEKGFDNAMEELQQGLKEVSVRDIATKRDVRFTKSEDIKKYFKDFKDKYMDSNSPDAVGGSKRERYAEWIDDNEKRLLKDLQVLQKGGKPKLPARPSLQEKETSKKDFDKEFIKIYIAEKKEDIKNLGGSDMDVINEQKKRYNQLYKKLFTDFKVKFNGDILEEKKEEKIKTNPTLKKLQDEFSKGAKKILDKGTKKK